MTDSFAQKLLTWHKVHGRHDLPWQHPRTAYRVWLSEVMLQQTQVATVIGYFERFIERFPTLPGLAAATDDEVMALWAGLGYYSRARNLHKTARRCVAEHNGDLPTDIDELIKLPGIGRSTAGAILAQAHGMPYPILDGNAKRVLARYHAVAGWPGKSDVLKTLWSLAELHTPTEQVTDYTQAIMDLGASLCRGRQPDCGACPLSSECQARADGNPAGYPGKKPKREIPQRSALLSVCISDEGSVLLEKRPPSGIWGGLWSLPMIDSEPADVTADAPVIHHTFTHFKLAMTPVLVEPARHDAVSDRQTRWCGAEEVAQLGLPRPVQSFLDEFFSGMVTWQER
ncbi:MAG: A/G-specific adenine glycosylase [Pseudomonadota bacterium]